jgi:hypothetical protein
MTWRQDRGKMIEVRVEMDDSGADGVANEAGVASDISLSPSTSATPVEALGEEFSVELGLDMVVGFFNPSYLGNRERRIMSEASPGKVSMKSYLKK